MRPTKYLNLLTGALAAGALAFGATSAQGVPIDTFDAPSQQLTVATGTETLEDNETAPGAGDGVADATNIIGGWRDITTEVASNTDPASQDSDVSVGFTSGHFVHSQGNDVVSTTTLIWDGFDDGGLGSAGDLSAFERIEIELVNADHEISWQFLLTDTGNDVWEAFVTTSIVDDDVDPPQLLTLDLLNDFTAQAGSGALDLANIFSIALVANTTGEDDFDTAINYIELVDTPEPATLSIFGAGLLGLGALAARRRKS